MCIEELIKDLRKSDEEAHEAALALGLLLEQKKVHHPIAGDDGGIREILGDELANRGLSEAELRIVVDELLTYIDDKTMLPHPMAVWALSKSYEERILPHIIDLLTRVVEDPTQENLAYQALIGIINVGVSSSHRDLSISAIRQAARQGHGRVMETATRYLEAILGTNSEE